METREMAIFLPSIRQAALRQARAETLRIEQHAVRALTLTPIFGGLRFIALHAVCVSIVSTRRKRSHMLSTA